MHMDTYGLIIFVTEALPGIAAAAADMPAGGSGMDALTKSADSIKTAALIINIVVGLMLILWLALKIRNEMGKAGDARPTANVTASTIGAAIKSERKGDYITSAANYEALGDYERAGAMYEKARDFARAAAMYEKSGHDANAASMYLKAGESVSAAAVYMRMRNYAEAAKIFKNKGDTLRAAQAFEMMGNSLAAAREYELAGQYMRAVKMYKNERLYKEAAAMYQKAIADTPIGPATLDKHYTYAAFLLMAGELEGAEKVYASIASVDSAYKNVGEKLRLIGVRMGKVPEVAPEISLDRSAREVEEHQEISARIAERELAEKAALKERLEAEDGAKEETPPVDEAGHAAALAALNEPAQPVHEPVHEEEARRHAAELEELAVAPAAPAKPYTPGLPAEGEPAEDEALLMNQGEMDTLFDEAGGADIADEVDEEGALIRESSLRAMMTGTMEPRYGMRIWMQVLKSLYAMHREGTHYGSIRPEAVYIDMQNNVHFDEKVNNVRFDDTGRLVSAYTAPEVLNEVAAPDALSDVYCIGVLLYEMVTGDVSSAGQKKASEINSHVPAWMDTMIARLMEPDRAGRIKSLDEISEVIKAAQGK